MTREELRNNYEDEICKLCCREYFTSRACPESLCEGNFCELKINYVDRLFILKVYCVDTYSKMKLIQVMDILAEVITLYV